MAMTIGDLHLHLHLHRPGEPVMPQERPMAMPMRLLTLLLAATVATACGSTTMSTSPSESSVTTSPPVDEGAAALAAAVEHLASEDHTFGEGPPPFTEYLIQSHLDPAAGTGMGEGTTRPLTRAERSAIEAAVSAFGPVRWIDDPAEWRDAELRPTIEGAVILGVGEPRIDGASALVPVSLWCGGTCGTWLTYRLESVDGDWQVVGTDGPVAIS